MKIVFVVPDPGSFRSGGNVYNECLLDALRKQGAAAVQTQPADLPDGDLYLVDTLYAPDWKGAGHPAWLIVHHLESLFPPPEYDSQTYFERFERSLLDRFDGFLVSSDFTRDYLRQRGLTDHPIVVVPPALDERPAIPDRSWKSVRALMVANLVRRKGILPFLEALSRQETGELRFDLIGEKGLEPDYARDCLALIDRLPGVRYRGTLPPGEMGAAYRAANLFISASYMETYGMALQEAAAAGLPLLVYAGGNAPAHVRAGDNGVVFETIPALAEAVADLSRQPARLEELGRGARRMAQADGYDWAAAARKFYREWS